MQFSYLPFYMFSFDNFILTMASMTIYKRMSLLQKKFSPLYPTASRVYLGMPELFPNSAGPELDPSPTPLHPILHLYSVSANGSSMHPLSHTGHPRTPSPSPQCPSPIPADFSSHPCPVLPLFPSESWLIHSPSTWSPSFQPWSPQTHPPCYIFLFKMQIPYHILPF